MDEARLLQLEERFWKGDADFYRANVADDAVMVFPEPVGILHKEQIVAGIERSERWTTVAFDDVTVVDLGGPILLVYRAEATRGPSSYSTLASSLYVRRDGSWSLTFHQHTPL